MNNQSIRKRNDLIPVFLMGSLFVVIHTLTLLVLKPLEIANTGVFENPNDPVNLLYFFLTLILFTGLILLLRKFWRKQLIRVLVLGATGLTTFYLLISLSDLVFSEMLSLFFSVAATAALIGILVIHPEWYVIDLVGIVVGVGAIGMFGISLSVFLVIALLIGLALYDSLSVYKTKHMIDLADTILDLKLPVILVIPRRRDYSLIRQTESLKDKLQADQEREAFFMGLGDVIMPGLLVASVFHNVERNGLIIAFSVLLGTLLGFIVLMRSVMKGKPQAGLPYLCSGAILGYLISSYVVFGELVGLF